jgi:hypothetical protein
VVEGRRSRAEALNAYHDFSEGHRWKFETMLAMQRLVPRVPPRLLWPLIRAAGTRRAVRWSFGHYLDIAHPAFARASGPATAAPEPELAAA